MPVCQQRGRESSARQGDAMDLQSTLALYARGRKAWNAWSDAQRAKREALEAKGLWQEKLDSRCDVFPANEETAAWSRESVADFYDYEFAEPVDFSGFRF